MKKAVVVLNVDKNKLKNMTEFIHTEEFNIKESLEREFGWLEDSGISLDEVLYVDDVNEANKSFEDIQFKWSKSLGTIISTEKEIH